MEKALNSGGSSEGVLVEHYGDILFRLGDAAGALEQWKKARTLGGHSDLLERKITEGKLVE
jgi:predicted negative regulator of RcsB-dependent stress response